MHYKRQTTVLSVIFVLVGMMFLVPVITEKAMAQLVARADGMCGINLANPFPCHLTLGNYAINYLVSKWQKLPTIKGTVVSWSVMRHPPPFLAPIIGYVHYFGPTGGPHDKRFTVDLTFNSPVFGANSCNVDLKVYGVPSPVPGSHWACDKGSGLNPKYFYHFQLPTIRESGGSISGSDSGGDNGDNGDSSGDNGDNDNGN
jgi:hypothetical protein